MDVTKRGAGLSIAGVLGMVLAMIGGLIAEDIEREQYAGPGAGETVALIVVAGLFLGSLIALLVGLGVMAWSLLRRPQRD